MRAFSRALVLAVLVVAGCGEVAAPMSIDAQVEPDADLTCEEDCGDPTACATPFCDEGSCDPGFTSDDPADPTDGDCKKLDCTGTAAEAVSANDDTDLPADLPCADQGCSGGTITSTRLANGVACLGEVGVCDGAGGDSVSCRTCRNTQPATADPGCGVGTPHCDQTMAAGEGVCNAPTTWDPAWSLAGVTFSNGNLSINSTFAGSRIVRTTVGKTAGKYYWEVTANAGNGSNNGGIGIATSVTPNDAPWIGYQHPGMSFGYGDGYYYFPGWTTVTAPSGTVSGQAGVNTGVIYMFALDLDGGLFWAGQNGTWYNGGNPAAAAAPTLAGVTGTIYPGVTFYNATNAFTANFGASGFSYAVPAGFTPGFH